MNAACATAACLPPWGVMWLLAAALFFAGKALMLRGARVGGARALAFTLAWAGMDAVPFRRSRRDAHRAVRVGLIRPAVNAALGAGLLFLGARHFTHPLAAGWVGMVGLVFILHFGIFGWLAAAWRSAGVPVVPIMRCPLAATSLADFWGRRWNLAFRDLAHRAVFVPVCRRMGRTAALWAVFLASGLAHELVISVPAGAGFGLPTLYFSLQALGMTLERSVGAPARLRRKGSDGAGRSACVPVINWLRTHAFTVLPVFLLFHPPFVERVMVPFFHAIGALP